MPINVKEEPDILSGVGKQFLTGVPYSHFLTRGEQILKGTIEGNTISRETNTALAALKTQQSETAVATTRTVQEVEQQNEISARGFGALFAATTAGHMAIDGRLQDMQKSLGIGLDSVASAISESTNALTGIKNVPEDVDQLVKSGKVKKAEAVILAMKGALSSDQASKVIGSLKIWEKEIIASELIHEPDPKIEAFLPVAARMFLAEMRRISNTPIGHFESLPQIARSGALDSGFHHTLAEQVRTIRIGIEGVNYSAREMLEQGDTSIVQRNLLLQQGHNHLQQGTEAIKQRDASLRLARAGIFRMEQIEDIGNKSLIVQQDMSTDLNGLHTLAVQGIEGQRTIINNAIQIADNSAESLLKLRNIQTLTEFANHQRAIVAESTMQTSENTGQLVRSSVRAELQRSLLQGTALELLESVRHYGDLQESQLDQAQATRVQQLALGIEARQLLQQGNSLLQDVNHQIGDLQRSSEEQVDVLINVADGIEILQGLGEAQLIALTTLDQTVHTLHDILKHNSEGIKLVVEGVKEAIKDVQRTLDRFGSTERQRKSEESLKRGLIWMKKGHLDRAIKAFDLAEEDWDLDSRIFFNRAMCYIYSDKAHLAKSDFQLAFDLADGEDSNKTRATILLNLAHLSYSEAQIYLKQGKDSLYEEKMLEAIENTQKAINEMPTYLEAQFTLAIYLVEFRLLNEALKVLMQVVKADVRFSLKIIDFQPLSPLATHFTSITDMLSDTTSEHKESTLLKLAQESLRCGNLELATEIFAELFLRSPINFYKSKLWALPEIDVIRNHLIQLVSDYIEGVLVSEKSVDIELAYSLSGIMVALDPSKRALIYRIFSKGTKMDIMFKTLKYHPDDQEWALKCKEYLEGIFQIHWDNIREIIRRVDPSEYPILNTLLYE